MPDLQQITQEMTRLYLSDDRPWIIGYSGGKDSTCVTQLAYQMLANLSKANQHKSIHIVSSDTLVESPMIDERLSSSLQRIKISAKQDKLPIKVQRVKPDIDNTFWVNLIGRGYPSPNRWFRWCTDRLKIKPITKYIMEQVMESGEVIILLGARKSESGSRAQTMGKYEIENFKLRRHISIPSAFVYSPIEDLSFKDVWNYLLHNKSPWGDSNQDLRRLYKKVDRECPLVIDVNTPSCGGSRFGCWTCTVVNEDKSLRGLIEDGEIWLTPLGDFRDWLKVIRDDPEKRDTLRKIDRKRKMRQEKLGKVFQQAEHRGHKVLGPFTFETRHEILKKLIETQQKVESHGLSLISPEEIKAIETIWIYEGDNITSIVDAIGLPNLHINKFKSVQNGFIGNNIKELRNLAEANDVPLDLIQRLLVVEQDLTSLSRKSGVFSRLEKVLDEYLTSEHLKAGAKR